MEGQRSRSLELSSVAVVLGCLAIAIGAGVVRSPRADTGLAESLPARVESPGFTTSNTCLACHPDQYDSWHRSYHRTMTQVATAEAVLGDFDVVLETRGYEWALERRGEELWVEMPDPAWFDEPAWFMQLLNPAWPDQPPTVEARVVMTTGSHHMQNYWVRRPEGGALGPDSGALVQLPWVWLVDEGRWVPNQDSFLAPPSASIGGIARWNANCSQCHSVATEPRASEALDTFDTRTTELGIACEACHGPAERHVAHYGSPIRRYLRYFASLRREDAPDPTIVNPAKLDQRGSVEVCGQCHSFGVWTDHEAYRSRGVPFVAGEDLGDDRAVFRFAADPTSPELLEILAADSLALESRFWSDGTIRVAGREYNGFIEDVHATESDMTCLSCHSMHEYEDPDSQLAPTLAGDRSCLGCHADLGADVSAHTRHARGSSGSECMNCHMPHTTYGLFSAMRSHRIDSPSVESSVATGRPNACNLCHLDQSSAWSNRYLNEWYGQPLLELGEDERNISAAILAAFRGDAVQRTIFAWHLGWGPARAASGEEWIAPYLAQLLTDPYSATRQVAYRSLRALPGFEDFAYDYVADVPSRGTRAAEAVRLWRAQWAALGGEPAARLLIDAGGEPNVEEWVRLLALRDQRPLTIRE